LKPDEKYITICDNENLIKRLLFELVLSPRVKALGWSKITKQTPNMKIGYPGQHLASLITGIEGSRTGARGDDLEDGTEVKSCSRVDQLDSCKDCKKKVLRIENNCPHCDSDNVKRMDDSKWLFSVKSEPELQLLTKDINRVLLTIADYPNFINNDFNTIRFQAFEIWNNCSRHKQFSIIMKNYYYKIFLEHIKRNPNKTPAPKNFWPYSYQFYLCNPIKVLEVTVAEANTTPSITINQFVLPDKNRANIKPEMMPTSLLNMYELQTLVDGKNKDTLEHLLVKGRNLNNLQEISNQNTLNKNNLAKTLPYLDESARNLLPLRDTDKISESKTLYKRR